MKTSGGDEERTPEGDGFNDPSDLARYIGDMTENLSRLAQGAKLDLLAHLLDVARLEAVERSAPRRRPPQA